MKGKTRADAVVVGLEEKYKAYLAKKQAKETAGDELKDDAGSDSLADGGAKKTTVSLDAPERAKSSGGAYYVIEIRDCDGKQSVEVVEAADLSSRLIRLQKDYLKAKKAWEAAKKDLGDAFDAPKPLLPKYKTTKVEGKDEAEQLAGKLQKKLQEQAAKAGEATKELTSLR